MYVFGSNDWGQLGLGHKKSSNKPSFIKGMNTFLYFGMIPFTNLMYFFNIVCYFHMSC